MSIDSDISAAVPEPPPPRPAQRAAAIEEALRRYDADGGASRAAGPPRAAPSAPWRGRIVRPYFAAFATIALVALIGLPVWMSGDHRFSAVDRQAPGPVPPGPAAPRLAPPAPSKLGGALPPVAAPKVEPVLPNRPSAVTDRPRAGARDEIASLSAPESRSVQEKPLDKGFAGQSENRGGLADMAPSPPPPPPAPPPPAAVAGAPPAPAVAGHVAAERSSADMVVTGTRVSQSLDSNIVVTGQRRSAAKLAGRGDWNACTVDDPNRDLGACTTLIDPAAPGADGRAAAHVADALSLAWRSDPDGAIAAFDRAIAVSPHLSFAYLNRGLVHAHRGELKRAIADLDQAVRYAPKVARNYYQRSLVWRQRGDSGRADADQARAVALDQRYRAIVR